MPTPEDLKWFRVEVSDHDGQIVAIEPGMLAGRDIGEVEEAKIRGAIEHLQGFVGSGAPFDFGFFPEDESSSPETPAVPFGGVTLELCRHRTNPHGCPICNPL